MANNGDAARTFPVEKVSEEALDLIENTPPKLLKELSLQNQGLGFQTYHILSKHMWKTGTILL